MLRTVLIAALAAFSAVLGQADVLLSPALQKIIDDVVSDPKYDYPTSLTREIVPKAFVSDLSFSTAMHILSLDQGSALTSYFVTPAPTSAIIRSPLTLECTSIPTMTTGAKLPSTQPCLSVPSPLRPTFGYSTGHSTSVTSNLL